MNSRYRMLDGQGHSVRLSTRGSLLKVDASSGAGDSEDEITKLYKSRMEYGNGLWLRMRIVSGHGVQISLMRCVEL